MNRVRSGRFGVPFARAAGLVLAVALAGAALSSCTPPQLITLRSGLDSLRTVVDSLNVRDAAAYRLLEDTRREVGEQRDILLSTRATTGSTTKELFDQMGRLEGKLDEVMGRFQQITERAPAATPGGADAQQLYDQASGDLAQGRYALALQGFRDFVRRFPTGELSDNAQYGVGECLFAQSLFDSSAIEYARVDSLYPQGDKVPAALFKLALSQEKLGRTADAKNTFESLVRRYPLSGEAQLARERLGTTRRR
jgi:tol-pal system protein YbgF